MQYEKLFRTQSVWKSIFSLAVPSVIIILVMILPITIPNPMAPQKQRLA